MITFVYIVAASVSVWLAFVPWMILCELKRQGKERRADALKIISLLAAEANREAIPRPPCPTPPEFRPPSTPGLNLHNPKAHPLRFLRRA